MATKRRKSVSINALEKYVSSIAGDNTITKEWNGIEVIIQKRLSLTDMMRFVNGVVKSCFSEEDSSYLPEARDFALRCSVMEMYANFTLPQNVEKKYDLVYGCDACEMILAEIDRSQFDAMLESIDSKIEHIAQASVEGMQRQINELYYAMNTLYEKFGTMFDGIDQETMTSLVSAISSGRIDEEKLMKTYLSERNQEQNISIVPEDKGE